MGSVSHERCPKCGDFLKDPRLIACPKCGTVPGDYHKSQLELLSQKTEEIKKDISVQVKMEVKSEVIEESVRQTSKRFRLRIIWGLSIIGLLFGAGIYQIYNTLTSLVEDRIAKQFEEPRIRSTLEQVAKTRAEKIISEEIQPSIQNVQQSAQDTTNEIKRMLKNEVTKLKEKEIDPLVSSLKDDIRSTEDDLIEARINLALINPVIEELRRDTKIIPEISLTNIKTAQGDLRRELFLHLNVVKKVQSGYYPKIAHILICPIIAITRNPNSVENYSPDFEVYITEGGCEKEWSFIKIFRFPPESLTFPVKTQLKIGDELKMILERAANMYGIGQKCIPGRVIIIRNVRIRLSWQTSDSVGNSTEKSETFNVKLPSYMAEDCRI